MTAPLKTLADRMGVTIHQSSLRFKFLRLMKKAGISVSCVPEDAMVDLVNHRGAKVVFRGTTDIIWNRWPSEEEFSNEELVVALSQLNCADRPQILRLPAQLISQNQLNLKTLLHLAIMERAARTLKALAVQALRVEPSHPAWSWIADKLPNEKPFLEPLIHWMRLAEPQFAPRKPNPIGWKLVA